MIKRKIDKVLLDWKNASDHKPMILKGARQVGKTTSVLAFAEKNYQSTIQINFYEHPEYKRIFEDGYSPDTIIRNISIIHPEYRFIPGKTLIFFDEIQEYMDATASLKFFAIDGRYDVICSGSALGINYHHISSISVGYKQDMDMYSLDFEEFLLACGYDQKFIDQMADHMVTLMPFSDLMMSQLQHRFMDYLMTGGMPAVVSKYMENQNFSGILDMQKQILKDYDEDIGRYTEGLETAKVRNVYRHIAAQLGKENHKFQVTKLGHGARAYQYQGCEDWLADAGIVNNCYCANSLTLPLKGNEDAGNFRMYFGDTSLLLASLDEESQYDLRANRNLGVYKGAMYENFAAEALKKQGYELHFFKSTDGRTELDFIIRRDNMILPIEVKANRGKARSMNAVIEDQKISMITSGLKFGNYNVDGDNHIVTYPFFCMFLMKRVLNNREDNPVNNYLSNTHAI
jgi:predicted AAA+ superfamily ATPase